MIEVREYSALAVLSARDAKMRLAAVDDTICTILRAVGRGSDANIEICNYMVSDKLTTITIK